MPLPRVKELTRGTACAAAADTRAAAKANSRPAPHLSLRSARDCIQALLAKSMGSPSYPVSLDSVDTFARLPPPPPARAHAAAAAPSTTAESAGKAGNRGKKPGLETSRARSGLARAA